MVSSVLAANSYWFYRLRKSLNAFHLEVHFRFAVMAGASPSQLAEKGRDRLVMRLTGSKRRGKDMIERMFDMEDTISWMVVRNPLSRIVSAYRWTISVCICFDQFHEFRNKFECKEGKEFYYQVKCNFICISSLVLLPYFFSTMEKEQFNCIEKLERKCLEK